MICIYWAAPSGAGMEKLLRKDTKLLHFNELKLQVRDAVSSWPWLHFDLPLRGREPGWSGVCCCFISLSVLCRTSPAVPRLLSEHAPGLAYCNCTGAFGSLLPSTCPQELTISQWGAPAGASADAISDSVFQSALLCWNLCCAMAFHSLLCSYSLALQGLQMLDY